MNTPHHKKKIILTAILFWSPLASILATPNSVFFSENNKKHSTYDSISIDQLLGELSEATPIQRVKITNQLKSFSFHSFSSKHKEKLQGYLIFQKRPPQELILFSGFLKMETTLLVLAKKHPNNKPLLQKINMALVRSGNFSKTNTLWKNLEKLTVDDPFVYEILPLLAYTKERIIYDWLLNQIKLNQENCHPADAESAGNINCAYRIIEAIAPAINEFPIPLDKWGDLNINSYSKGLEIVRKWIEKNQKNYTLNKHRY